MVGTRGPKFLLNRLQWAAKDFRDSAKVRRAGRRRGPQIQQWLNARHGCCPRSSIRNKRGRRLVQALSKSFVVSEQKGLIFLDRPAQGSTKLVPPKRWCIPLVEEIRCIQHVVAQKLKRCPVPLIRSRLRYNHHLPAGALAEFGSVRVALHIELAYGVHAEQHPARSSRLHVVLRRAGKLHAVQQKKILLRPVSGNSEIVSRGGIRYPCSAGFHPGEIHDAGIQRQQQIVTSPVQREVLYLLFAHQAGNISRRRAYHGSILSNRDLGLHRAHF